MPLSQGCKGNDSFSKHESSAAHRPCWDRMGSDGMGSAVLGWAVLGWAVLG